MTNAWNVRSAAPAAEPTDALVKKRIFLNGFDMFTVGHLSFRAIRYVPGQF
jgi:hypothetical protein